MGDGKDQNEPISLCPLTEALWKSSDGVWEMSY